MKTYQELKEYLGGFRLGSFPTMKPIVSLGDKGPNKPAGQQSLGVGINATYSSQAAGTMRPFLKAQKKKKFKIEGWWDDLMGKLKSKTLRRRNYNLGKEILQSVIDRKKKGGKLNHSILYYAQRIGDQIPGVHYKTLAKMVHEETELEKYLNNIIDKGRKNDRQN